MLRTTGAQIRAAMMGASKSKRRTARRSAMRIDGSCSLPSLPTRAVTASRAVAVETCSGKQSRITRSTGSWVSNQPDTHCLFCAGRGARSRSFFYPDWARPSWCIMGQLTHSVAAKARDERCPETITVVEPARSRVVSRMTGWSSVRGGGRTGRREIRRVFECFRSKFFSASAVL